MVAFFFFFFLKERHFSGGPVSNIPCSQYEGPGLFPSCGTRLHMPQLRICMPQLKKTPCAAMKIEDPITMQLNGISCPPEVLISSL